MLSYSRFTTLLNERASESGIHPTNERAYHGKQEGGNKPIAKSDTGKIGERIVMHHLKHKGHEGVHALNSEKNNYPVDVATRHHLIEVKTGLTSNNHKSHHWRATIGQPGKHETEWLKKASPKAKAAWNKKKTDAIMSRKNDALKEHSKKHGVKMTGKTYGVILHHDKKVADVHEFHGFHHRIAWNHPDTHKSYVGSYKY
jgi:hypothetical protein